MPFSIRFMCQCLTSVYVAIGFFLLVPCFRISAQVAISCSTEILYNHQNLSSDGQEKFFPIRTESFCFGFTQVLSRVLEGDFTTIVGNIDVLLDIEKEKSYEIDHDERTIFVLPSEKRDSVKYLKIDTLDSVELLGHRCVVISFSRPYRNDLVYVADTIRSTYYLAPSLTLSNPLKFAALQGNKNTVILDGRLSGIPLKIISEFPDGSKLITEAKQIRKSDIDLVDVSKYRLKELR